MRGKIYQVFDYLLLACVLALVTMGILCIYS